MSKKIKASIKDFFVSDKKKVCLSTIKGDRQGDDKQDELTYYDSLDKNISEPLGSQDIWSFLNNDWKQRLSGEFDKPYFKRLTNFLKEEMNKNTVYPPRSEIFNAFNFCPPDKVRVVIIGMREISF